MSNLAESCSESRLKKFPIPFFLPPLSIMSVDVHKFLRPGTVIITFLHAKDGRSFLDRDEEPRDSAFLGFSTPICS